jgi:hypothetical protein
MEREERGSVLPRPSRIAFRHGIIESIRMVLGTSLQAFGVWILEFEIPCEGFDRNVALGLGLSVS